MTVAPSVGIPEKYFLFCWL